MESIALSPLSVAYLFIYLFLPIIALHVQCIYSCLPLIL